MTQVGRLPEWLGTGLQNRGQRFESARYLQKIIETTQRFRLFVLYDSTLPKMVDFIEKIASLLANKKRTITPLKYR